MAPTLADADLLVVIPYTVRIPQRGDVVVFHPPGRTDSNYVKRVIGVAGDHIQVRDGRVIVNGVAQHESYVASSYTDCRASSYCDLTVAVGAVFVLGDNRDASDDSRLFGTVAVTQIEGEVMLRVWPVRMLQQLL